MILDQKQKQFWNRHAKRNNNPRDANVSVLLGVFVSRSNMYVLWQFSNLPICKITRKTTQKTIKNTSGKQAKNAKNN